MSRKKSIHVFIGAPTINRCVPQSRDDGYSGGSARDLKAWRILHKGQRASPQNDRKVNGGHVPTDRAQTQQLGSEVCCSAENRGRQSGTYSRVVGESPQKVSLSFRHEDISDLVSGAQHFRISPHTQRSRDGSDRLVTCDYLEGSFHEKTENANINLMPSAKTEFISVLVSSQVVVQSNVGTSKLDSFLQIKLERFAWGNADARNESFTSSPELFTPSTDDDGSSILTLKDSKDHLLNRRKEKCKQDHHLNNIGSSTSKRKNKAAASLHFFSKKYPKSKKPLLKYVNKGCNQTPCTAFTLLKNCSDKNLEYSILAVVMQPCHIKEIQIKNGLKSGSTFPLATVVVLDQSEISCKILMWRAAAHWSLALCPGDIIIVTNLKVCEDKWNRETLLQCTFRSSLKNLGNCFKVHIDDNLDVEYFVLMELIRYISTRHYYLKNLLPSESQKVDQIQHVRLSQLQPETLVHSVLKVNKISPLKYTYLFKESQQNKIVLTVEEVKGQSSLLILWGASVSWCDQIYLKRDHIWEFKYLLCKRNVISGDVELHTTPWSTFECLFDDDKRAVNFRQQYFIHTSSPMLFSIRLLTEERYSGIIQIKGSISEMKFPVQGKQSIIMTQQSSVTQILLLLPSITYSGCKKCKRELNLDTNCMYEQCFVCLPFNQLKAFYRPAVMTIIHESNIICAYVASDILQKIFLNICPKLLNGFVTGSRTITNGTIVADLCCSLLAGTGESYLFTIESYFSLDDNSMPLGQEFNILDLQIDIKRAMLDHDK